MAVAVKYEAIFALVNQGYADIVMDAARKEGARGGTIIHARGSANEVIEKNYGMFITPDKELVFTIVDTKIKNKVMDSIYKAAGIETKGMGIIFSTPAENVAGIK